jgi:tRNA (guanine37-N1)-methyltransferase
VELHFVTIFPGLFEGPLASGVLGIAEKKEAVEYNIINLRHFADDKYGSVDDYPYGGGPGMIMMAPPIVRAVESVMSASEGDGCRVILLSPGGRLFDQPMAAELAEADKIIFICGRYKGVDERVGQILGAEPVSIGDYILSGGELAALVITDAVVRHLPGIIGDEKSRDTDSFSAERGSSLDAAYYTRPPEFRGLKVPEVLIGGNHGAIAEWREQSASERTKRFRSKEIKRDLDE